MLTTGILCAIAAGASDPKLKWEYQALSNLYAPPLVADMHHAPGLETIIADSEAKTLRCIDARGEQLWEQRAGWTKRLISAPALSSFVEGAPRLLVVGNADGSLTCLRAGDGLVLWRKPVGAVEWGGALWADITGDGVEEIIYGTKYDGVLAIDRDGELLWRYRGEEDTALEVQCPLAAADIDGDGRAEILGCAKEGPFCLTADGTLRWRQTTAFDFVSGPVVTALEGDGAHSLIAASRDDNTLWCFDAATGEERWRAALFASVDTTTGSSIAVGDIDRNLYDPPALRKAFAAKEIVIGDMQGTLYAFEASGLLRWTFTTAMPGTIAPTLGDVDGDGAVEVLAAAADHALYCLNSRGEPKWRFRTNLRLIHSATIADVNADGKTEVLVCGGDHSLRCLTLDGAHEPYLLPWPARRGDAQQTAAVLPADEPPPPRARKAVRALPLRGDFEHPKEHRGAPIGWRIESPTTTADASWELDGRHAREGASALKAAGPVTIASGAITVDPRMRGARIEVFSHGAGARAPRLRFLGASGLIDEVVLEAHPEDDGWTRWLHSTDQQPCFALRHGRTRWAQLVLENAEGEVWWDAARLEGVFFEPPELMVLVNQVGYDVGAPKAFVVQANWAAEKAEYVVLEGDEEIRRGALEYRGRIVGAHESDWGYEYWHGVFTDFEAPGVYRILAQLDDATAVSYEFEIGDRLLWERTARPAYRFFYYQRCGADVPGFHKACHLDDAASPDGKTQCECWGGWHDAGDYNTYHNAPYVLGLLHVYAGCPEAFDAWDEDGNGRADLLDEILWGGDRARRMIAPDGSARGTVTSGYGYWGPPEMETDNIPGTGDERHMSREDGADPSHHQAALARIAAILAEDVAGPAGGAPREAWVETAARSFEWSLAQGRRGPFQLSAALDLLAATGDQRYAEIARETMRGLDSGNPGPGDIHAAHVSYTLIEAVRRYDAAFGVDHAAALRAALVAKANALLPLADNPFGVCAFGTPDNPNFFNTPAEATQWRVGTNSHLLGAAAVALMAYRHEPDPRYLRFAYDQINWVLGMNPFNTSLMEGCGDAFPPTYHHRYTFAGVPRGAVPGSVINGITYRGGGDDRPSLDLSGVDIPAFESNECWLPHNVNYLVVLTHLPRETG